MHALYDLKTNIDNKKKRKLYLLFIFLLLLFSTTIVLLILHYLKENKTSAFILCTIISFLASILIYNIITEGLIPLNHQIKFTHYLLSSKPSYLEVSHIKQKEHPITLNKITFNVMECSTNNNVIITLYWQSTINKPNFNTSELLTFKLVDNYIIGYEVKQ